MLTAGTVGSVDLMSILDSDLTHDPIHPGAGDIFNVAAFFAMAGQEG